ncbi:NupC/NupG family nucleoside CNT transporter [Rhodopirellula sp. MGV]|uniref:NupC/NupG family nucleoside CNT transporter n=1 Tax=Rhodopirellula sp. MGV TaxID=2023130 RepID=UPI000B979122|nr:nucleoside transporter C-terminal domain-containing protein [Rhodopirellula sp. MGV]OYP32271.1 NupC/NupG family nucleoside CNT transporter [Rhodopirellula sp. MGV]PNY35945.1 NupC/NupG family nucleoside CNT transporter [Rhodopirellula baltica]
MERFICLLGIVAFIGLAWLVSSDRKRFPVRVVVGGLLLQFVLAFLVLRTDSGRSFFAWIGEAFTLVMGSVNAGSGFLFSSHLSESFSESIVATFAFGVLPTVIFFSSLMSILYYIGVMQWVVYALAWVMQFTLKTSGPETLAAAANVFVGHTEAPLVVRPYLRSMTRSELNAMMTGGFATVTGGLLGAYAGMGIDVAHLLTASVISAPAALLIAKIMQPEAADAVVSTELAFKPSEPSRNSEASGNSETSGDEQVQADEEFDSAHVNVVGAAVAGASDGLKLALNVGAMLIAFLAILNLVDVLLAQLCFQFDWTGLAGEPVLSLGIILGYACWPIAWLLGIPATECMEAGRLIGLKTVANEFIAYQSLGEMMKAEAPVISNRTAVILTYALAGFSNFGAIGIQVGGIGGLEPSRRKDLAQLGLRAMFGGLLACCMTGAIAGLLL